MGIDSTESLSLSRGMGKHGGKAVRSIEEFDHEYLPEMCKQYPVLMRVTEEEQELILWRRGGWYIKSSKM